MVNPGSTVNRNNTSLEYKCNISRERHIFISCLDSDISRTTPLHNIHISVFPKVMNVFCFLEKIWGKKCEFRFWVMSSLVFFLHNRCFSRMWLVYTHMLLACLVPQSYFIYYPSKLMHSYIFVFISPANIKCWSSCKFIRLFTVGISVKHHTEASCSLLSYFPP